MWPYILCWMQRMKTVMWHYILCCKAKNGDCIVALYSVFEGKWWAIRGINMSDRKRRDQLIRVHMLKNLFTEFYNVVQYLKRRICTRDIFICLLHVVQRHQVCTCGQIITGQWLHFCCKFSHICKLLAKDQSFVDRAELQIPIPFHCKAGF